jgi:predicted glycoside hydrolase/deacetylase ChbG (UPF0249 family)
MEIIVTADDLGICPARNRGILRAVRSGVVSSVSLMANGAAGSSAVRDFTAAGKQQLLGLHLNLTEGRPLSPARLIPSLLRCGGRGGRAAGPLLMGAAAFREAWQRGDIDPAELAHEASAQLSWFRSRVGAVPAHMDSHQHVHVLPGVPEVLAPVLRAVGVRHTRIPWELLPPSAPPACPSCRATLETAREARAPYARHGVVAPHHFVGLSFCGVDYSGRDVAAAVERAIARGRAPRRAGGGGGGGAEGEGFGGLQVVEVMTHPGDPLPPGAHSWDEFNAAPGREKELSMLCSPKFRRGLLRGLGGREVEGSDASLVLEPASLVMGDGNTSAAVGGRGQCHRLVGYADSQALALLRSAATVSAGVCKPTRVGVLPSSSPHHCRVMQAAPAAGVGTG